MSTASDLRGDVRRAIVSPVVSEKSYLLVQAHNQYTFRVLDHANKAGKKILIALLELSPDDPAALGGVLVEQHLRREHAVEPAVSEVVRASEVDPERCEAVDEDSEGSGEVLVAEGIGCRRVDPDLRQLLQVRGLRCVLRVPLDCRDEPFEGLAFGLGCLYEAIDAGLALGTLAVEECLTVDRGGFGGVLVGWMFERHVHALSFLG